MFPLAAVTKSLMVLYVITFFIGVGLIGRFTTGFVLLTELTPKRHQAIVGASLMIGDSAATLYITAYLRVTQSATGMVWIGFVFNIISLIGIMFLTESPEWLVSVGRTSEGLRIMQKVAKINGV